MLEIKGLKKAFGSLEVLKGVDLKVKQALCQLSGACGRRQPDL